MYQDCYDDPIPYHWTPDEALAVVEFLEVLADRIWSRYGISIYGCTRGPDPPPKSNQLTLPFPSLWQYGIFQAEDEERPTNDIPL